MKIRRFVAKDMKTALAQIKDELGEDAVIMSNKKIPEGVELMAAVDFNSQTPAAQPTQTAAPQQSTQAANSSIDERLNNDVVTLSQPTAAHSSQAATESAPADSLSSLLNRKVQTAQPVSSSAMAEEAVGDIEQQFKNFTDRLEQSQHAAQTNVNAGREQSHQGSRQTSYQSNQQNNHQNSQPSQQQAFSQKTAAAEDVNIGFETNPAQANIAQATKPTQTFNADIDAMQKEMASIRALLEHQLSGLMWQDMAQRAPMRAVLINRLMEMGITENVADQVAGYIPMRASEEESWQQATQIMTQQLRTTGNEIIHQGGIFSLVGPTGVGKTTTIAKLAARFAQIHGADNVVLISTDSYRIAGFEQLSTYGKIIGCQVKLAKDAKALDELLQFYASKKLILIDTAGMGQRDMRLAKHLTTLVTSARVRIKNYLVLSANTQSRVMQENVDRFKTIPLSGCIFTKLDESLSVGEIVATAIQNGLPIGYLTDGQRVPEDIKVANAEKLVTLADRMAKKNQLVNHASWRSMPTQPASVVS